MLVKILLFARLRDITGGAELQRQLPEAATAQTAWNVLAREFPALAEYEGTVSCAVNQEYARFGTPLADGDEVAFLPPVSGGETRACNKAGVPSSPVRGHASAFAFGSWELAIWELTPIKF